MAFLLALTVPFAYRGYRIAGLPDIGHPFDVEEFGTVEISDDENAFVEYRLAWKALIPKPAGSKIDDGLIVEWPDVPADIKQWLEDNRPTLKIWRKGTEKPDALYQQPTNVSFLNTSIIPVSENRALARLARLEIMRLEAEGKTDEAWQWILASFRFGLHLGMRGTRINRLVGAAVQSMSREAMLNWCKRPDVDEVMLIKALREVQSHYKLTTPISTQIKMEYFYGMNTMDFIGNNSEITDSLLENTPGGQVGSFFLNERELATRVYRQVIANELSQIDKPRYARAYERSDSRFRTVLFDVGTAETGFAGQLPANEIFDFGWSSYLYRQLVLSWKSFDGAIGRKESHQAAVVTIFACQIFYREHGMFPETLDELVPDYLEALPADPYGKKGETIHYLKMPEKIIVYSVGTNGIDDGGNLDIPAMLDLGLESQSPGMSQ